MTMTKLTAADLPAATVRWIGETVREGEETIVWAGRPVPAHLAWRGRYIFLFGVAMTAFAVAATFGLGIPLLTIPFVLAGVVLMATPLWRFRMALHSAYVITDKRALVFNASWWQRGTVHAYHAAQVKKRSLKMAKDGSGDIVFETEMRHCDEGDDVAVDIGFLCLANIHQVDAMLGDVAGGEPPPAPMPLK